MHKLGSQLQVIEPISVLMKQIKQCVIGSLPFLIILLIWLCFFGYLARIIGVVYPEEDKDLNLAVLFIKRTISGYEEPQLKYCLESDEDE